MGYVDHLDVAAIVGYAQIVDQWRKLRPVGKNNAVRRQFGGTMRSQIRRSLNV